MPTGPHPNHLHDQATPTTASFSPFCLAWTSFVVHFPGLNLTYLGIHSGCCGKVIFQLLDSSPLGSPKNRCWGHWPLPYREPSFDRHLQIGLGKTELLVFLDSQSIHHNIDIKFFFFFTLLWLIQHQKKHSIPPYCWYKPW